MATFELNLSQITDIVDDELANRERDEKIVELAVGVAVTATGAGLVAVGATTAGGQPHLSGPI